MSASSAAAVGTRVASAGARAGRGISSTATQAAGGIRDIASSVVDSVSSIVPDVSASDTVDDIKSTADNVKAASGQQWDAAVENSRKYGRVLHSRLSESLEQQPLLLGAIGLAIGAGVASAFATTSVERELMGEFGTAARDTLNEVAGQAKDLASNVVSDLKDEANKQGFTTDAVAKAADDIVDKVEAVVSGANASVSQNRAPLPQGQTAPMSAGQPSMSQFKAK